ncbi:TPA: hypothetical protein HA265_04425 [Candidatus Woesearchaeota archaeon]|nr:hypothetical protein [Candidatus Woesearchaeota archaeon]
MDYLTIGIIAGVVILVWLALKGLHWAKMLLLAGILGTAAYFAYKFFF